MKKLTKTGRPVVVTEEAGARFREYVEAQAALYNAARALRNAEAGVVDALGGPKSKAPPWVSDAPPWLETFPPAGERDDASLAAVRVFDDLLKVSGIDRSEYFRARYHGEAGTRS